MTAQKNKMEKQEAGKSLGTSEAGRGGWLALCSEKQGHRDSSAKAEAALVPAHLQAVTPVRVRRYRTDLLSSLDFFF